jgi:glyoxylate reductase
MKPKVYVTRMIPHPGIELLKTYCEVEINAEDRPLSRAELLDKVRDKDGVIGLMNDRIDGDFFDAAPNLRGYANYAVGYDNIDVPEATKRRIPVSNTPDVLTDATAELAWALLFAVARRVVELDAVMRSGQWSGWGPLQFLGADVCGKTLGIVGAGRIGTAMALMSRGFRMPVIYANSSGRRNEVLEKELGASLIPFDELLERSDYISLHAPLTPQSRHLFNAKSFARMKKTAILINTGRGPLIKEDDLVQALKKGQLSGAGLDVYEFEPRMAEGLAALPNTVLLPHIGSATDTTRTNMATMAARNLLAMLRNERPETCLNPEVLAQR